MSEAELEAFHQLTWRLDRRWTPPTPDATVWFAYDPLPWADFLPGIRRASELTEGRTFLDIGCGIGTKLAFMSILGWSVSGIDHHQPYLDSAAELVPEAELRNAEILDVDDFVADLIYMYRPAVSEELERLIDEHVASSLPSGALLFVPHRNLFAFGLESMGDGVWRSHS